MAWLTFSSSLAGRRRSSDRVRLWRRLRRLGAVTGPTGVTVLPDRPETREAFAWLAQEVRRSGGEALVLHVRSFNGLQDRDLVRLFQEARRQDYRALERELRRLEAGLHSRSDDPARRRAAAARLARLRQRQREIRRIDFFPVTEGRRVEAHLARLERRLTRVTAPGEPRIPRRRPEAFRGRRWVTRPRPYVDRLACIWFIRRFIDPNARVRYADRPRRGEVAFDMEGGEFTHVGPLCTFEVMVRAFGLSDEALTAIGEIVHELDLQDRRFVRAELAGVDAVLRGWHAAGWSDRVLEACGVALFDGLYRSLSARTAARRRARTRRPGG
ncbi:MAG: chromate resistance protein [Armatimonadota bacterium]|nr:chromate resistance protein [Armatimonadota bacterium]MDR7448896.1 chromate resistance protein [Armatimonadota bacterium]MDR7460150.1 chromate resistance protein [Armatimonadota bacterium]MDR7479224.1 chromate resistance protein [Armatimonadota bacterium]MDR7487864.1 chromate resistance protein [Armatimonadota bacterium]